MKIATAVNDPDPASSQCLEEAVLKDVQQHYHDALPDYLQWSPHGNLHFGYWRKGISPLQRHRMLREMNRLVFDHLDLEQLANGSVADLGCGIGGTCHHGWESFPHLQWHGVNVSTTQLDFARQRLPHSNIKFHHSDYHRLPWPDSSINCAYFLESFCYSTRPNNLLREVYRVLVPGGKLVIVDGFLLRPLQECNRLFRTIHAKVASNWAVPAYHQLQHVLNEAIQAGLVSETIKDLGWRIAPSVLHAIPLASYCAMQNLLQRTKSPWRWRQLIASGMSLFLGLQRRRFRYCLLSYQKPFEDFIGTYPLQIPQFAST